MSRNVVLRCDGTGNEFAKHQTTVLNLYAAIGTRPPICSRRCPRVTDRRLTIPLRSLVHASAFERGDECRTRLPSDAIRVDRRPTSTA